MPDETSDAAAEGTAYHELASHCLTTGDDAGTYLDMWVDIQTGKILNLDDEPTERGRFWKVDEEMVDGVMLYVEHIRSLVDMDADAQLDVEQRLEMFHIHRDISGTGDATVYLPSLETLHVGDLKAGKGVIVEVDDNPQVILYGAGATRRFHNQRIRKVVLHIVQPRAPHPKGPIRSYEIDLIELFEFEDMLAKAAQRTDDADAPFKAGPWCYDSFCKLQATCPANRAFRLEAAGAEFGAIDIDTTYPAVDGLSSEQRARVLHEADGLLAYVKAVQQKAHDDAMRGELPAGFKLVPKRANRKWRDEDEAKAMMLELAVEPYQPAKLKSPAMAEPGFPGKNKAARAAAMDGLVTKVSSGFNLVPSSDPRPAAQVGAASDFETIDA